MSKDMDFFHSRDIFSRIWRNKLLNSVKKRRIRWNRNSFQKATGATLELIKNEIAEKTLT